MGSKRKRGAKEGANSASNGQKRPKKDTSQSSAPAPTVLEKRPFVEILSTEERQREAAIYELLASEDVNERIEAADCIISSLLDGDGVPEAVLQRHLQRKLFAGLASGRKASRLGRSLVITELLGQLFGSKNVQSKYPELTFEKTLGLLVDKTKAIGNISGQEERDHFFGQLFGLECFVRSEILFTEQSRWDRVLELLLRLGSKKIWLRSQCGWILVQALNQMSRDVAQATLSKVADAGMAMTPEGVAIWLVALQKFPDLKVKPWRSPLANKSLGDVTAILKESFQEAFKDSADDGSNRNRQPNSTTQMHFVWDVILGHFTRAEEREGEDFDHFWVRVVDDGLFSKQATDGQKFKGFTVFQKMLEGLAGQPDKLQSLFSKNFMVCLMNQAAKVDRYLHRAATKALKAIEGVVSSRPDCLVPILEKLLGKNGAYNFDERTNTKTVEKLLGSMSPENEKAILAILRKPLSSLSKLPPKEGRSVVSTYVGYLSRSLTVSSPGDEKETALLDVSETSHSPILQELSRLAFSQPKDIPESLLTDQMRTQCRSNFAASLTKLIRKSNDFSPLFKAVTSAAENPLAMDDEIKDAMEEALSRMRELLRSKPKQEGEGRLAQGLAMLHAVSIFQLYNEEPDAMEVLSDLAQYFDKWKEGKLDEDDEGGSEFLVEILLSMVARPSSLMRDASQRVFDAFTSRISAEGLSLLTDPLASGESTKGQKELFNTEDDEVEADEDGSSGDDDEDGDVQDLDEMSDVEMGSDVEFINLKDAEEEDGSSDEDEDEEDSDAEDGDDKDGNQQELLDLEANLGKILNSHRLDQDADAESSESDADMSDSEMMALDDKLGEFFKQQVKSKPDSKKQKKDAKQSVIDFKNRILDLLGIYVKNEALNPLTFAILLPLLNLIRTTSSKELGRRACELIATWQKNIKKARGNGDKVEGVQEDDLLSLLVDVHAEAGKDNSHMYARAASAASLIIASTLIGADEASIKHVWAVYAKTGSEWGLGEAKLQSAFFVDWINWVQNLASQGRN
ncbi:DNA polymerase phi-domain-containing protein [Stachybotrys elegans]|uniref:DNA polymerase phi-domain-containing protein n=1 Tax=Stachybotrys elegans TaxID=80388 RepID=A0A8K0SYU8_9HYPO|nr:DNA polymerase phi-domain-containing protein [Stachybotrys elegans]